MKSCYLYLCYCFFLLLSLLQALAAWSAGESESECPVRKESQLVSNADNTYPCVLYGIINESVTEDNYAVEKKKIRCFSLVKSRALERRLSTFNQCNRYSQELKKRLAKSGMCHTGEGNTQCFSCEKGFGEWAEEDDPDLDGFHDVHCHRHEESIDREDTPHDILMKTDPEVNDRYVMEIIHKQLCEIKESLRLKKTGFIEVDGFYDCFLVIQNFKNESSKLKFRIHQDWTCADITKEINKLYNIPVNVQTVIVGGKNYSSEKNKTKYPNFKALLDSLEDEPDIVYIFLSKKKIDYRNSNIRVSDIVPARNALENVDEADDAEFVDAVDDAEFGAAGESHVATGLEVSTLNNMENNEARDSSEEPCCSNSKQESSVYKKLKVKLKPKKKKRRK